MSFSVNYSTSWDSAICELPSRPRTVDKLSRMDFVIDINKAVNDGIRGTLTPSQVTQKMQLLFEENPQWAKKVYPEIPKGGRELDHWVNEWISGYQAAFPELRQK